MRWEFFGAWTKQNGAAMRAFLARSESGLRFTVAASFEDIKKQVQAEIWHEIGHYVSSFIRSDYHSRKNGSIFATEVLPTRVTAENRELSKNLQMAKKMADNGFDVYLLSNPQATKSADFIIKKGDKVYYTEGKLSTGKNSLDHNLSKGSSQSERIIIDLTGNYNTNYISSQLIMCFQQNEMLKEVMLLKGGRLICITSRIVGRNDFKRYFKTLWEQKK